MSDTEFKAKTGMTREQYLDQTEAQTNLSRSELTIRLERLTRYFDTIVFTRAMENPNG